MTLTIDVPGADRALPAVTRGGHGTDSTKGSTTAGYVADSIYCGSATDTIDAGASDQIFDTVQGGPISGGNIVVRRFVMVLTLSLFLLHTRPLCDSIF